MKTLADLLRAHPLFADADSEAIAELAGCALNVHFRPGEVVFREGDEADAVYLLRSGRVAVQLHRPGGGPIVVDTVEHDEVVGWSWLVPPFRWGTDAVAVVGTSAMRLDAGCVRGKCAENPAVGYAFLQAIAQTLAHRLASANHRLLDLYGTGERP